MTVPAGGYQWWYVDGLSEDGRFGLTLIAFIGSVFSPYYAWARQRGPGEPLAHCAFNVALYGPRAQRWSMTERPAARVQRSAGALSIGPSTMCWRDDALEMTVDEVCAPLPYRLRGRIRLRPAALQDHAFALDGAGVHRWTPYAPCARVEVDFHSPALRWSGPAYFDSNAGEEPLERAFEQWTWSRASRPDGTVVLYDCALRDGTARGLALAFAADGRARAIEPPPLRPLPPTGWRITRSTRADPGSPAQVLRTLTDSPFYSRSLLHTCIHGVAAPAIHESLDLGRFKSAWVRCLLPFRMPRVTF